MTFAYIGDLESHYLRLNGFHTLHRGESFGLS